jgi:acyl-CoA reductase-like NAD-dependent aldehyde dehydrogenase
MAKFIPSEHVERLEYDFTEYGGEAGTIAEPTTGQVNQFFNNMKSMFKEVRNLAKMAESAGNANIEDMTEEQVAEQMGAVDEASEAATEFQARTIEALAELCGAKWEDGEDDDEKKVLVGGSPSLQQLELLPYRVMQAFSTWLLGEIRPKKTTPGTNR